ncbi:MAG: N-acetylmuramoyl-L-alanine amidase [Acidobacteria bacterium]|nr:N-acetylmuramoyl-L-alanine amidase [Acidobacteriota bacterium]
MHTVAHNSMKVPSRALAEWVEWRAGRIDSPVERLGYLRRSAAFWGGRPFRKALMDARAQRLSAFLGFVLLLPAPMITDGASPRNQPVAPADLLPRLWQVESASDHELYSNGLRIEKRFTARTQGARPFQRWRIDTGAREESTEPHGIVFHMTESDSIDYNEDNNKQLRRLSSGQMGFVRGERAYHFVIDRFGRVFRTVPENEPANHAGNSVWADDKYFYVNMNHSFIGVAFDGQTRGSDGKPTATEAQVQSARLLTQLLRTRYRIRAVNCVPHAQISVNPSNMGVGWHVDWASGFPFEAVGLPKNYLTPLPAITLFGFRFDDSYANVASEELQDAISAGETVLRQEATSRNLSTAAYRRILINRYRALPELKRQPDFSAVSARTSNP